VAQGHGDGDGDVAIGFWDVGLRDMWTRGRGYKDLRTWGSGDMGTQM